MEAGRVSLSAPAPYELQPSGQSDILSEGRVFSMERDLQIALRQSIGQLESGLVILDGGAEKIVPSGRIDIFASDADGTPVVIELKAVRAQRDAVAQILAYMGDVLTEKDGGTVRGLLVAPEFDAKAVAAAKMVPTLSLVSYSFSFLFEKRV